MSTASAMSLCENRYVRSMPSASTAPGALGNNHFSCSAAFVAASSASVSAYRTCAFVLRSAIFLMSRTGAPFMNFAARLFSSRFKRFSRVAMSSILSAPAPAAAAARLAEAGSPSTWWPLRPWSCMLFGRRWRAPPEGSVVQRRLHHRNGACWGVCGGGAERQKEECALSTVAFPRIVVKPSEV